MAENVTETTTETLATPATLATLTMPTVPRKIDLSFNLLELSDKITTATNNLTAEQNNAELCKRLRRALLNDESYDGVDKSKQSIYSPHGTLATAKSFLEFWESGLISIETRRDPDQRNLNGLEVLRFGRDNSGQSFNIAHSFDHVMGAPVFAAIRLALDHGWRGETEPTIANRIRAGRERLEILRESLPSAETLSAVETYISAAYATLSSRIESVSAPLAAWVSMPIDPSAPIDLGALLSPVEGTEAELHKVNEIAHRWMFPADKDISPRLEAMRARLAKVGKALQARAEEIRTQAQRLGR